MTQHTFPFRRAEGLMFRIYALFGLKRKFKAFGKGAFFSPYATGGGLERVSLAPGAVISRDCVVLAFNSYAGEAFRPEIVLGERTYIGRGCVLSAAGSIRTGIDVVFGDNVYIGGAQHGHEANGVSVFAQPLITGDIEIGDRAWIGFGAFINARGRLTIGEHAVVGANSVVTKDVPAFTMVAGVPAVPIKRYDHDAQAWRRIEAG